MTAPRPSSALALDSATPQPPLAILVAVTGLGPLALNIFMPSMPGIAQHFAVGYEQVQLSLTLYLIGFAVSQLVYGPLSDRFGRRPVLLSGLVLFVASSLICALAVDIGWLLAGRLGQGIGGCAGMVLARAVVRDVHGRDRSASMIAYITMAMVVAPMLAPAIGGYLDQLVGWRAGFWFTAATGAVVLAFAVAFLHETLARKVPLPGLRRLFGLYAALGREPAFRGYAAQTALTSAGFFGFLGGAPHVVIEIMGRSQADYGLFFMLSALGYMSGNFIAGRLSTRLGLDRMIGLGIALSAAGALLMVGLPLAGQVTAWALFGPMLVFGFGNGLSLPNGLAGAVSVRPDLAGTASGVAGCLQMGTGAAASVLVGWLVADAASQLPLAAVMLASTLLAGAAWALTPRAAPAAAAPETQT
jgi:DHA1 family bicyclomycin/chloramphenicol resistance-like MFS transporter